MRFENKRFDWKKKQNFNEHADELHMRKEKKKERREKYKVKNQKFHQIGWDSDDEYGGMF